jgi:hypothetical protein
LWKQKPGKTAESVEVGVEWFKLSKPRAAKALQVPTVEAPVVEEPTVVVPPIPAAVTAAEPPKLTPPAPLQIPAMPAPIPAKSPKAVFDTVADQPRLIRPIPKPKIGFTISSSKDGETSEVQLTSPTLTVAKARMLFKSGWRVHITNAAGRQFAPSEFDDVLKFD